MKRWIVTAGLALTLVSGTSWAIVIGGSNLGVFGYPEHDCVKPRRPLPPVDQWAADSYNRDARRYRDCMIEYLENAENDIKRIKEKMEEVVDEASG